MNISQLRTFLMVAEHGSFSAAARAMHLSQPAVTMQVQALEADLGVTLLDRQYRKVETTEAGAALLPFARRVLDEIEDARDELAALAGKVTGRLELAASTTPGQYVLPRLLGSFLKTYPQVTVALAVMDTAQVVDAVESGAAGLGVTGAQIRGAKAKFERVAVDELVMVCPPDHEWASARDLTLARAVEAPFVMREEGSGTRLVTEDVLREAGVDPGDLHVVTELGTGEAIVNAVEGGVGIAIVSRFVAHKALELGTIKRIDVGGFPASRPLYAVITRGTPTRAAAAFLQHLRDNLVSA